MDEFAFSSSAKRASSACAYDGHGSFFGLTNADSPDGRRLTLLDILRLTDLSSFCINRERPFNEDPLNRGKRWGSGLPYRSALSPTTAFHRLGAVCAWGACGASL